MKRALLCVVGIWLASCAWTAVDDEARYACPCMEGYVCGSKGTCVPEDACDERACEALGWECGVLERCGQRIVCGECEHCGALDPGKCGGCRPDAGDLPDENFYDRNCDGIDGDRSSAVFVDPVGGSDSNDGRAPERAVKSLLLGLNLARDQNLGQVLVAQGNFDLNDKLRITRPISLHGRYAPDAGWRRGPDVPRARIDGINAVMEQSGTEWRSLSGVELHSRFVAGGYSAIGVTVESPLEVWDLKIVTGDAKHGALQTTPLQSDAGEPGSWGVGPSGGEGGRSPCGERGGAGGAGGGSSSPRRGDSTDGGAVGGRPALFACGVGEEGGRGAAGAPGDAGAGGVGPGRWEGPVLVYADGTPGTSGTSGGPGAGGGGGGACPGGTGGGGGGGGGGGCGGKGGLGGEGGGHVTGLVVIGGALEIHDVEIQLGRAGDGSAGTRGAFGALGAVGGTGGVGVDGGNGGRGGSGGRGGNGGPGGGGAGGWAVGLWCVQGGRLDAGARVLVDGGVPGTGLGDLLPGSPGERHLVFGCDPL